MNLANVVKGLGDFVNFEGISYGADIARSLIQRKEDRYKLKEEEASRWFDILNTERKFRQAAGEMAGREGASGGMNASVSKLVAQAAGDAASIKSQSLTEMERKKYEVKRDYREDVWGSYASALFGPGGVASQLRFDMKKSPAIKEKSQDKTPARPATGRASWDTILSK